MVVLGFCGAGLSSYSFFLFFSAAVGFDLHTEAGVLSRCFIDGRLKLPRVEKQEMAPEIGGTGRSNHSTRLNWAELRSEQFLEEKVLETL